MSDCIMVGCDLHDKSMLLRIAVDRGQPVTRTWGTSLSARQRLVEWLRGQAERLGAGRIVFAYEASGLGFGLCDQLRAAGIGCEVLAPSNLERSSKHVRRKTDERDAQQVLNYLRSYVLAGVEMPSVWIPDRQTRDDRELVRHRLALAEELTRCKNRIAWLLKRQELESPGVEAWTLAYRQWLEELVQRRLPFGAAGALASLLRQLAWLEEELLRVGRQLGQLARQPRHAARLAAMRSRNKGVGILTGLVFLTELGDMGRFGNRRQLGSFLGLTPSSHESGQSDDRKGHITHQGPARVRKVLCQAVWSRLRTEPAERAAYERLVARNPKHKKIAVVARMRALAVRLWHDGAGVEPAAAPADNGAISATRGRPPVAEAVPGRRPARRLARAGSVAPE